MSSRYRIRIGGKFFEVEIGDISSSPVEVKVDGVVYSVDMDEEIGRAGTAPTVQQPSSAHTTNVPGDVPHPSAKSSPSVASSGDIQALLPGRIVSVGVQPGDEVTTGQPVAVIESMKMEQTIASSRDGKVKSVSVSPGDTVAYGQTLIEFE